MTTPTPVTLVEKLLQYAGAIAVPLLLAALAATASAFSALANHGARDAVIEQRVVQVEDAVRAQAASAARIEGTVTGMRVDQSHFVGAVEAKIEALEGHHKPRVSKRR